MSIVGIVECYGKELYIYSNEATIIIEYTELHKGFCLNVICQDCTLHVMGKSCNKMKQPVHTLILQSIETPPPGYISEDGDNNETQGMGEYKDLSMLHLFSSQTIGCRCNLSEQTQHW